MVSVRTPCTLMHLRRCAAVYNTICSTMITLQLCRHRSYRPTYNAKHDYVKNTNNSSFTPKSNFIKIELFINLSFIAIIVELHFNGCCFAWRYQSKGILKFIHKLFGGSLSLKNFLFGLSNVHFSTKMSFCFGHNLKRTEFFIYPPSIQ